MKSIALQQNFVVNIKLSKNENLPDTMKEKFLIDVI